MVCKLVTGIISQGLQNFGSIKMWSTPAYETAVLSVINNLLL